MVKTEFIFGKQITQETVKLIKSKLCDEYGYLDFNKFIETKDKYDYSSNSLDSHIGINSMYYYTNFENKKVFVRIVNTLIKLLDKDILNYVNLKIT